MRKIQLSIKLETFGDKAPNGKSQKIQLYSDGNDLEEVIARAINTIRIKTQPETKFKDFCNNIKNSDIDKEFFGSIQAVSVTEDCTEKYVDI